MPCAALTLVLVSMVFSLCQWSKMGGNEANPAFTLVDNRGKRPPVLPLGEGQNPLPGASISPPVPRSDLPGSLHTLSLTPPLPNGR